MPTIYCHTCQKKSKAPEAAIGKTGACPFCGAMMKIPGHDEPPPLPHANTPRVVTPVPGPPNAHVDATSFTGDPPAARPAIVLLAIFCGCRIFSDISNIAGLTTLGGFLGVVGLLAIVAYIPLWTKFLSRTWSCLPATCRPVSPAIMAGLMFVPVFNLYWIFVAVRRLAIMTSERLPERQGKKSERLLKLATVKCVLFVVISALLAASIVAAIRSWTILAMFLVVISWLAVHAAVIVAALWHEHQAAASAALLGLPKSASFRSWQILACGAVPAGTLCLSLLLGYTSAASAEQIRANEMAAVARLRELTRAQGIFRRTDYDRDGLLEYAQRFKGGQGEDGLLSLADGRVLALIPKSLAQAAPEEAGSSAIPDHGYFFKLLDAQGRNAPGGAMVFVSGGNMIHGYAFVAYPARYGVDGVRTYIQNSNGDTYMRDLGPKSTVIASKMREFDPDDSWSEEDWVPRNYLNECPKCGGTGNLGTPCYLCRGYGKRNGLPCNRCDGSGMVRCDVCGGTGARD